MKLFIQKSLARAICRRCYISIFMWENCYFCVTFVLVFRMTGSPNEPNNKGPVDKESNDIALFLGAVLL